MLQPRSTRRLATAVSVGLLAGMVVTLGGAAQGVAKPVGHPRTTSAAPARSVKSTAGRSRVRPARPKAKRIAKPAAKPVAKPVAKAVPKKPVPAARPVTAFFESRVTAGNGPVKDKAGRTWAARPVGFGSWRTSKSLVGTDVKDTIDDALYQVNAYDVKWYRLAVPAAATYRVRLLMAESYWSEPGKRVFDVRAEGRTMVQGLDLVKAAGKGHAHDVVFTVPVRDGELNLEFPASVDYSLLSAIEVVSTTRVQSVPPKPVRRAVTFAPRSFWTQDVSRAPLAANSASVAANLSRQVSDHYGGVAAFNAYEYNTAFHVVSKGTRRVNVSFFDCQRRREVPSGLFDGDRHFVSVPVPPDALPATGTDSMMSIYDPAADKLWEFWQMRRSAAGGWQACWGGRVDRVSKNQGHFPGNFGTSASGVVLAGGMITIDEATAGEINHAMALGVVESRVWPTFSWPAQRTDGGSRDPNMVMHGQRLRLDPSLSLDRYDLTPIGRMVAKAAQRYGFLVVDRSGAVAVGTESGKPTKQRTGVNPWDGLLVGPAYQAMKNFPWDKLQALPPSYGKN